VETMEHATKNRILYAFTNNMNMLGSRKWEKNRVPFGASIEPLRFRAHWKSSQRA